MQQSTGDLERCSATLLEAIELVPGDDAALRLRLTSACAACENFLGRHEPAERRLVATAEAAPRGLPRGGGRAAGPCRRARSSRSSSSGCATGQTRACRRPGPRRTGARGRGGGRARARLRERRAGRRGERQRRRGRRASRRAPGRHARAVPRHRQSPRLGRVPHRALRRFDPPRRARRRRRPRHRPGPVRPADPHRTGAEHGDPRGPVRGHRAAGGGDRDGRARRQRLPDQRRAHRNREHRGGGR